MAADHQVAHGAADQESLVAALAQAVEHAQRIGTDVLARNRMLVPRDDAQGHGGGTGGFGEGLGRHRQPLHGWRCRFSASVSLLYYQAARPRLVPGVPAVPPAPPKRPTPPSS